MSEFHAPLLRWYDEHARDLPWRRTTASAWGVLVSESMLQQTPVARVLPVYEAWMEQWPTPAALAASSVGDAIRAWGRLGYPRRATRLHAAATMITEQHDGAVPDTYDALRALPGVGDYTASAVLAFAFGRRQPVLDTNVRRVLARVVSGAEFAPQAVTAAEKSVAASLLPDDEPTAATWSVAVMELGSTGLHRGRANLRHLPPARPLRLAARRPPGVRRTAAPRAGLGRHRPAVPGPADGAGPGRRGSGSGAGHGTGLVGAAAARRDVWPD